MTKEAEIGYGIVVAAGANPAAITATVTLGGLKGVTPPSWERGTVDVTGLNDGTYLRKFIPGLAENGDLELELHWLVNNTTALELEEMKAEREPRLIELRFPNIATPYPMLSFRAFLTGVTPATPTEEGMTCTATMKVTGAVTVGTGGGE